MAKTRRESTPEFKREAVAPLQGSGRPSARIVAEFGVQPSMPRTWRAVQNGARSRSQAGHPASPAAVVGPVAPSPADLASEDAKLRRELGRTRMERDVPKKPSASPRKRRGEVRLHRAAGGHLTRAPHVPRARGLPQAATVLGGLARGAPGRPRTGGPSARSGASRPGTTAATAARGRAPPRGRKATGAAADGSSASCAATASARSRGRRVRPRTTDSRHFLAVAPNLLARRFEAPAPKRVWLADLAYIPAGEGWLHLAAVPDPATRKVVGWAMRDHMRTELALSALIMAAQRQRPGGGPLRHGGRGSQHAAEAHAGRLAAIGALPSTSRTGCRHDNAPMECFFHTLEVELVHQKRWATRDEARRDLFAHIEGHYNRARMHPALGYLTPEQAEERAAS